MNILYSMHYRKRFKDIINLFSEKDKNVLELCFGDIYIARECKVRGINWMGIDLNDSFVNHAKDKGFNAIKNDLKKLGEFPYSDACIMSGSLYHFNDDLENLLSKILKATPKIIISEPIVNLSSKKGLIGKIAKILTNAGHGQEIFRFDQNSILNSLEIHKKKLNFTYKVISIKRDILIEITNEGN